MIQHYFDEGMTVTDAINAMSKVIKGSYACWLYHKNTKDLYLFRNSNPLSYYIDTKNGYLIFASTDDNVIEAYGSSDIKDKITSLDTDIIYKLEKNELVNVGKISPREEFSSVTGRNFNNNYYQHDKFDTVTINKGTDAFEYIYNLIETYENKDDDQTCIVITSAGEVQVLIKPIECIKKLDENGFQIYKSGEKLYDSDFYEYHFKNIEIFQTAVEVLKENLEPKTIKSTETDDKENFTKALCDLAEFLHCNMEVDTKFIYFKYTKGDEVSASIKRLIKKVGLAFRDDNPPTLRLRNNKHQMKAIQTIMEKLKIYEIPKPIEGKDTEDDDEEEPILVTPQEPTTKGEDN
jgi:hypothetical protein